jgi:hypothetical protein
MIKKFFSKLFRKKEQALPEVSLPERVQSGDSYGVTTGKYCGEFFVFVEELDGVLNFLSLPSMEIRQVPREKYEVGIKGNVLEYVERLPEVARSVCELQYEQSKQCQNDPPS